MISNILDKGYEPHKVEKRWYDFWENPKHSGRLVKLSLAKGKNQLVIRVRNGQFASGGFFVHLEK